MKGVKMVLKHVSEEEIKIAESRARSIREQKEQRKENFIFEQVIEDVVKENCKPAIDIIKGATDFKIEDEDVDTNGFTYLIVNFTKNDEKYKLRMYAAVYENMSNPIGKNIKKGQHGPVIRDEYEQVITNGIRVRLELYNQHPIWESDANTMSKKLFYPDLSEQDIYKNIDAANAVYVMDALRKEMEKSNLKSKLLSATKNLRIAGYKRTPFYGPDYSDAR